MGRDARDRQPAELVRELRGSLSHDRFAAILGTSRQTVIRWEKGTIPRDYAEALSEYSGGRYTPEQFNPRLTEDWRPAATLARLENLERQYEELAQRLRKLERPRRRRA
jgi:DNA-binding XRE family transcriptional regulator